MAGGRCAPQGPPGPPKVEKLDFYLILRGNRRLSAGKRVLIRSGTVSGPGLPGELSCQRALGLFARGSGARAQARGRVKVYYGAGALAQARGRVKVCDGAGARAHARRRVKVCDGFLVPGPEPMPGGE